MKSMIKVIAFYLPQFHPIPENDDWWGKGFTEWTNVGKAKPLFKKHYQPRIPADLGYYDLRVPETREAQAELAKKYGIGGFCYWHYWFGNGRRLLERPFNEVLSLGKPDLPFCLAWANESWKGFAHGLKNRNMLIEQLYPGDDDAIAHFNALLPAFMDERYLKISGKPIFMVYKPLQHPEMTRFIKLWNQLANEKGLPGIFFIGHTTIVEDKDKIFSLGFDAINLCRMLDFHRYRSFLKRALLKLRIKLFGIPRVIDYADAAKYFIGDDEKQNNIFPTIYPNWDHSPRSGKEALIFVNSTPDLFAKSVEKTFDIVKEKDVDSQIVFLKSWNEWGEGNYMEPDLKFGHGYLKALKASLDKV